MLQIFKALADENRIRIFNLLLKSELCVCEIETLLDMTQSNASRHLNKLKSAGLIESSKDAQWIHYKASEALIQRFPELVQYFLDASTQESNCVSDLKRLEKYRQNNLNCQWIHENKELVIRLIQP